MKPSFRQYADYFAVGILLEVCSVDEVITWADQLIEESDRPTNWMIELSTSADKHLLDVIHLLDLVPGVKDLDISWRLVIAKLGEVYPILPPEQGRFAQPEHRKLFGKLYYFVQKHNDLSEDVRGNIAQIYFDLDCVEQGYGDWSILQQDYEALLAVGQPFKQWIHL